MHRRWCRIGLGFLYLIVVRVRRYVHAYFVHLKFGCVGTKLFGEKHGMLSVCLIWVKKIDGKDGIWNRERYVRRIDAELVGNVDLCEASGA